MSLAEAAIQSAIEAIEEPRTARMDQLTKPSVKASIEVAADLMGIEASAFVVMSAYARAQELLSRPCFVEGDHQALLSALDEASTPTPALLEAWQLHQNQAAVVIYLDLWSDTKASPAALVQAFTEVVDQSGGDVVLIVDEVQQAITTEEGNQMLLALKSARDAINPRPGTAGHYLLLGTGSHRALV